MKIHPLFQAVMLAAVLASSVLPVQADDLVIQNQTISDTRTYDSPEATIFDHAVLTPTANVTALSTYTVTLKPGTRIETGARLVVSMKDNDGLPNHWEMQYFGNLEQNPSADYDNDGLTNLQEYLSNTDPTVASDDHDSDGLPDIWEAQYGNLSDLNGRNADDDNDGISNWVEYKLGTDPLAENATGPGIYYQYDKLGRVLKIERIPRQ